jgi:uncharacterized protein
MAKDLAHTVSDLMTSEEFRKRIDVKRYMTDSVGLPTLRDILDELARPGRDPREQFDLFSFTEGIEKIEDVKPGMNSQGSLPILPLSAPLWISVFTRTALYTSAHLSNRFVKNPSVRGKSSPESAGHRP